MKKGQPSLKSSNNPGFQYQSFAHLLYRQGKREEQNTQEVNNISPFKQNNQIQNNINIQGNTNTVSVSNFPAEGITNINQNIFK